VLTFPPGCHVYGIQLPVQSQSTLYAEPWEAAAGPDEIRAVARAAERHGFAYIACCDHVAVPHRLARAMGTVWYDPVATLSFLAAATERVALLSHVAVAGLRHPLVTAKQYATLDHLSQGRLILGVGAGHVREEFEALGVDFAARGAVLDETIEALKAALGEEEFPSFSGDRFNFEGLGQRPRPAQRPRPPLWVGGSSPPAIRRAALRADGWLPQGDPREALPPKFDRIRRLRENAGLADEPFAFGAIAEPLYVGRPTWDVGRHTRHGPAPVIADALRPFHEMGANQLQLRFRCRSVNELLDQLGLFAEEVMPWLTE
jgi:probable F420-dependent oxidoreductase